MRINLRTSATIGGGRREERSDYPIAALEQLVRNAVLHRSYDGSTMPVKVYWYSDRIEFINPGGLFGEVTPETVWQNITAYRNPLLAEGLKNLGVVERFGFGLTKAQKSLEDDGNPALGYQFETNFTLFKVEPTR
jgi:ATP-dependent DNA helicase RecG